MNRQHKTTHTDEPCARMELVPVVDGDPCLTDERAGKGGWVCGRPMQDGPMMQAFAAYCETPLGQARLRRCDKEDLWWPFYWGWQAGQALSAAIDAEGASHE